MWIKLSQEEASYYSYLKWLHTAIKSPQATATHHSSMVSCYTSDCWVEDPQATQMHGIYQIASGDGSVKNMYSCKI